DSRGRCECHFRGSRGLATSSRLLFASAYLGPTPREPSGKPKVAPLAPPPLRQRQPVPFPDLRLSFAWTVPQRATCPSLASHLDASAAAYCFHRHHPCL